MAAKITEDQYIKLCNDLNGYIETAYASLKDLSNNLNALMKGDSEGPYWNGSLAYNWVSNCLAHIDHDKVLLNHVDNCCEYLDTLVNGGSSL